jgi:hypothetical protein
LAKDGVLAGVVNLASIAEGLCLATVDGNVTVVTGAKTSNLLVEHLVLGRVENQVLAFQEVMGHGVRSWLTGVVDPATRVKEELCVLDKELGSHLNCLCTKLLQVAASLFEFL